MRNFPPELSRVYSQEQIAATTRRMGSDIAAWIQAMTDSASLDVVAVPVLRGGLFFFADLVRCIPASLEIAPVRSQVYECSDIQTQTSQAKIDLGDINVSGRAVLLVDDLCDSGKTLSIMKPRLLELGAREVRTAVLIRRIVQPNAHFIPDWSGFEYAGLEWFVGYGMDYADRWRNLPDIYIVERGAA